ncbi:MAG: aminotransferase class I/II-fold pyridoxal phosphate-dependent enzyme [Gemmatimonadetes bacterium]|nr:aminotransferase class I/II-fold pyridoxal phosphate-dependent enzyme [Gemmatimonadota bacterium]
MRRRAFMKAGFAGAVGVGLAPLNSPADEISTLFSPRARRADGPIRLSSNENPLGLSAAARSAIIEALGDANRYPGTPRGPVIEALAAKHGVTPNHIVLGNGSSEVLQMATQCAGGREVMVIVADPTFEDVPGYARDIGLRVEKVPLRPDWSHDLDRMRELTRDAIGPVLVYICNPNNPTGTLTASRDLDAWIAEAPERVLFAVDEAYFEFVNDPSYWSAQKWIGTHRNVLVIRTFSKIYAMAGLRLGYAIAHPDAAARLSSYASGNNANYLALVAASASLTDQAFAQKSLETNRTAMRVAHRCLTELSLEYLPSHTNFLMHRIQGDLATYNRRMREKNIQVGRAFPPMLGHSRVSIGLPEEMEAWAEALRSFRQQGWV